MSQYNLTVQMEKYDPAAVESDLKNLDAEIADEDAVNTTLLSDAAERAAAVREFLATKSELIASQHARMLAGVKTLNDMVTTNMKLEAADADYAALVASDEAQRIARLLTELNAMSEQYLKLLLDTNRAGRPPLLN